MLQPYETKRIVPMLMVAMLVATNADVHRSSILITATDLKRSKDEFLGTPLLDAWMNGVVLMKAFAKIRNLDDALPL
jgi:hypothetical protein